MTVLVAALGAAGTLLFFVGCYWIHPGLGLLMTGLAFVFLATVLLET